VGWRSHGEEKRREEGEVRWEEKNRRRRRRMRGWVASSYGGDLY
jgi:hypothetical protein